MTYIVSGGALNYTHSLTPGGSGIPIFYAIRASKYVCDYNEQSHGCSPQKPTNDLNTKANSIGGSNEPNTGPLKVKALIRMLY